MDKKSLANRNLLGRFEVIVMAEARVSNRIRYLKRIPKSTIKVGDIRAKCWGTNAEKTKSMQ